MRGHNPAGTKSLSQRGCLTAREGGRSHLVPVAAPSCAPRAAVTGRVASVPGAWKQEMLHQKHPPHLCPSRDRVQGCAWDVPRRGLRAADGSWGEDGGFQGKSRACSPPRARDWWRWLGLSLSLSYCLILRNGAWFESVFPVSILCFLLVCWFWVVFFFV